METKIDILNNEIDRCLSEMETKYLELFRYLDETPVSPPSKHTGSISEEDLKNYLESLRSQMATYRRTHGKPPEA